MTMHPKLKTEDKEQIRLSHQEIFDIIDQAKDQYKSYIELTSIIDLTDCEDHNDTVEHDLSYPLNISLK